jgi:NhaP-type Na+/H+ or K+/H+ antiporter
MGWFGIRGIGSLYYLSYALRNGLASAAAVDVAGVTISVVALSIFVHGITARPLLARLEE